MALARIVDTVRKCVEKIPSENKKKNSDCNRVFFSCKNFISLSTWCERNKSNQLKPESLKLNARCNLASSTFSTKPRWMLSFKHIKASSVLCGFRKKKITCNKKTTINRIIFSWIQCVNSKFHSKMLSIQMELNYITI